MSDDNIKENTLGGKKEVLSNALKDKQNDDFDGEDFVFSPDDGLKEDSSLELEEKTEETPKPKQKNFIPFKMDANKKEQVEAVMYTGGDTLRDGLDSLAGLTYKKAVVSDEPGFGFDDISIEDIDEALAEHQEKVEYFKKLKAFRKRYAGMSKDEIKAEIELGLKYIDYFGE